MRLPNDNTPTKNLITKERKTKGEKSLDGVTPPECQTVLSVTTLATAPSGRYPHYNTVVKLSQYPVTQTSEDKL
ncbi:hypothetical protein J6590_035343 [Homalodisca vitripennis]|nr:hypothetical protein J6590_035343 [Homalodisca vitripennis]